MVKLKKIYIEITNQCNYKCKFCKPIKRKKAYILPKDFEQILINIKPHTKHIYMHVLGEPLLHPQLGELLDLCERYEIYASITTNASKIGVRLADMIDKPYLRQVNYSLHSLDTELDNWQQILNDIHKYIKAAGSVYHCFRLWNVCDDKVISNNDILNYLKVLGYNTGNLPAQTSGNGMRVGENVFIQTDSQFTWPDSEGSAIHEKGKCYGLKDHIGILVDGTVIPCCLDGEGAIALGNIYMQPLEEILTNIRAINIKKNFESGIIVEHLCKTCGFIERLNNK